MKLWRYGRPIEILRNRYRLEGVLGSGGMAEVFLARDEQMKRWVAIKLLKNEELDQQMFNRFIKEAGQIVGWQHPHILRVYDHMQTDLLENGEQKLMLFFIAMEYASGGDLQKRMVAEEPFSSLSSAFTIFRQICGAVQYAHKHGVIHRDIKPLNILFRQPRTGPEEAVLSDFGLAVQVEASHHTFAHAGTLAYMAPEQLRKQAQPASDIFALGVTLYQLCTGYLPFQRAIKDLNNVLAGMEPEPLPPSQFNPDLPAQLDEPILRALQANPAQRYPSAAAFWNAIAAVLSETQLASETQYAPNQLAQASQVTPSLLGTPTEEAREEIARDSETLVRRITNPSQLSVPKAIRLPTTNSPSSQKQPSINPSTPQQQSAINPAAQQQSSTPTPSRRSVPTPFASQRQQPTPDPSQHPSTTSFSSHRQSRRSQQANQSRFPRFILPAAIATIVLLLLILLAIIIPPLFAANAIVTLIPRSQIAQNTYTFSYDQLHAHQLSAKAPTQSNTGSVSGTTSGVKAHGTLLFINNTSHDVIIPTTTFTGKSGISVTFNGPITVPFNNPTFIEVPAHAVSPGASGNIPQFDIVQNYNGSTDIVVKNTAFTGGADAQPNNSVQQSDIDQAAKSLIAIQTQQEQAALAPQIQRNEQAIKSTEHCQPTVTSDSPVGTQAQTVTVHVSVACTEEVYAPSVAQTMATSRLNAEIPAEYQLSGQVAVSALSATTTTNGTQATIQIHAQGQWIYTFSQARLKLFATLIANKSQTDARALLSQQPGIAGVQISTSNQLPSANHIQIKVQPNG